MFRTASKKIYYLLLTSSILLAVIIGWAGLSAGKDTDIYQVSTKQNCYILIDNSGSMAFAVYEASIDYGAMYDYLFTLNDSSSTYDYIYDTVEDNDDLYGNHREKNKIYLVKGRVGLTLTDDGIPFTGDPMDPDYYWDLDSLVDTHTLINSDGEITSEVGSESRITVDGDGYVLFDDSPLPLDRNILLTEMVTLYDGSRVNNGFGGLLNAPGYYFSGYEGVTKGSLDKVDGGETDVYFFVTGNWLNMHSVFNLHYTTNNPDPTGAFMGDAAWPHEPYPLTPDEWFELKQDVRFPSGDQYDNKLKETDTAQTITHPGAAKIQVHFSAFDVEGDGKAGSWKYDYVGLYDADGDLVAKYDNDNKPTDDTGWSATVEGSTVEVTLKSDHSVTGTGYVIDKIRVIYSDADSDEESDPDSYLMKTRLDVAKEALLYVLDEFHGKINWGYSTFAYTAKGEGDGATIHSALNPNLTDDANRAAIVNHVENTTAGGGTPLGEALQDVFEDGYWGHRNSLDNLLCRKNYVISVSDGYPSQDEDWTRISDVNSDPYLPIEDWDSDNWTADPSQYTPPWYFSVPYNYYDDVAHWMYTHSWIDKTEVADPANSYVNVTTHHVAFGMDHALMKDAAEESGGLYVAAYNKEQMVAAFYSLALQMTEAVSFTSPVVSVDAANKIQNGDDLYLGLFLPQDNQSWFGNLKKYKLGDGGGDRPDLWMLYDADNREAINTEGEFLDNTSAFWADDDDANDSDDYGSADVREDGVGEILTERVAADFAAGTYWERPIYTYNSGLMLKVQWDTLTATELCVADDLTRDKVINYLYGYTYDTDATTHAPTGVRDWVLGAIVHSRPVIIDYYDASDTLAKRLIAVGSNDGMLHIFDEADGSELLAFVPEDLLTKLQNLPTTPNVDMVDGSLTLYRRDGAPQYLIFGERTGGSYYWCLDVSDQNPLNWKVAWNFTNSEITQSWSEPVIAKMPIKVDAGTGVRTYRDVVILTGGYDPEEDNYPEPFNDLDTDGDPYLDNGNLDNSEWDKNDSSMDVNLNNTYDLYNLGMNEYGRGIFVFDIDDPSAVVDGVNGDQVLPFSVTYGATDKTTGATQTLSGMKWCFPASPAVLTMTDSYLYKDAKDALNEDTQTNVLEAIYAVDIYANVYKLDYDFEVTEPEDFETGSYSASSGWRVTHIFSGNPGSDSTSSTFGQGVDTADTGRKVFYPPTLSLGGSCSYFDSGNYWFEDVEFSGLEEMVTLFFGTGDREHPGYTLIRDRYYSVYDDSSVSAEDIDTEADIVVTTVPYTEDNLMNLSGNELDEESTLSSSVKEAIEEGLTDDATWDNFGSSALEKGVNEDDAKGWYIVLEDQDSALDHHGEKVLSSSDLFAGVLYFTTYQPSVSDPCNPQGNGFAYSMNYCDASAAYDLDGNDSSTNLSDDRYTTVNNIYGIPSDFAIVTREGQQGAMSMMGGKIAGPKGGNNFKIKGPGYGLELYYWRESDSQK